MSKNGQTLYALLDEFRAKTEEVEWLEFKQARTKYDIDKLGKYFSALANEANLKGCQVAWLIFGIHDSHRDSAGRRNVVGTAYRTGAAALNELKKIVADHTPQHTTFNEIHEMEINGKRVLMLEIPAAPPGLPITWKGHFYGRDGSSIGPLSYPELDQIRGQNTDWSAEIVSAASLNDLDDAAIAQARVSFKEKHKDLSQEVDRWSDRVFLNKARITVSGKITRAALLLLGQPEAAHFLSPADPRITWVLKNADGTDRDYEHFHPPYLLATLALRERIRNTTYRFMRDLSLFPAELLQYDTWVLRELLHNCIAHQDYRRGGRINVVEREDTLTFTNLGNFIPGTVEHAVTADAPPDKYRNPWLANAMVEVNMIDTRGSGIPKAFRIQRERGFPLPTFDLSEPMRVRVDLPGRVLDENYTRILFGKTELPLTDVMALDKVQKGIPPSEAEFFTLKRQKLIEGRRPNIYVAATVAAATGQKASYVKTAGFDDDYYRDLIVKFLKKFGQASAKEIQDTLLDKLPDALTHEQKRNKIRNLLQDLARREVIHNASGKRGISARWELLN
ncbi:MAG: RNA-binding domain-containing protein [Hyphomicrobiaceae bacterium]